MNFAGFKVKSNILGHDNAKGFFVIFIDSE